MTKQKIVIIGNGNIGQAIVHLLKRTNKKYLIEIYDKDPFKNKSKKKLKTCLENADFVFLCIPSWVLKEVLLEISLSLKSKTILISLAKGIDKNTKETVDELLEHILENKKYALLSGPMFAVEIKNNKMSFAVLASKDQKVFNQVSEIFKNTKLKLEYSSAVHAVAISAVLKNIYSLLCGMFDGFGKNNNVKGYLSCQIIKEMREIMMILKLNEEVAFGISGLGDFIATASSEYSQNIKSGKDIYHNGSTSYKSEGIASLSPLLKLLGKKSKKLPLLSLLEKILTNQKNPKKEIEKFFKEI